MGEELRGSTREMRLPVPTGREECVCVLGYDSPSLRTVRIAVDIRSRTWETAPDSSIQQGDLEQNVLVVRSIRIGVR